MKRTVTILIIVAVSVFSAVLLGGAACASNYDAQANSLKDIGLFFGTDKGFELDRPSTRAEAAVMLVRLLGKETEVKSGKYTHPLADAPAWADKYIGYMYVNGLTSGTSGTTFSPDDECSAQMFTTFVLRALGYSDLKGDFKYANAHVFALTIGLTTETEPPEIFLRDNMVALSYSALFLKINNTSGKMLLEKLVSDKAVDENASAKYLTNYSLYSNVIANYSKTMQSKALSLDADINTSMLIDTSTINMSAGFSVAYILKENDPTFKLVETIDFLGQKFKQASYYKNGWTYIDDGEDKYKYKDSPDISNPQGAAGQIAKIDPFNTIMSISRIYTETGTRYMIEYSAGSMDVFLSSFLSDYMLSDDDGNKIDSLKAVIDFDANGILQKMTSTAKFDLTTSPEGKSMKMSIAYNSITTVVATGDAVVITPPSDLNEYEDYGSDEGDDSFGFAVLDAK